MRVITEDRGLHVYAWEPQEKPEATEATHYAVVAPQLQLDLVICNPGTESNLTAGLSEEACVKILLDRLQSTLLQREPCDAYRRALYHLYKARECFHFHDRPQG